MNPRFATPVSTATFGLTVLFGSLVGCRSWRTVRVLSYAQGRALSEKYVQHHKPHREQARWLGPPATFTRYRRAHPTDAPVIAGRVFIQEPGNKLTPLPGAIMKVDAAHTFADNAEQYVWTLAPDRHRIFGGGVGFLYADVPPLRTARGDSIQINFHLLPEFRPTMN